jgi:hypothetical protein
MSEALHGQPIGVNQPPSSGRNFPLVENHPYLVYLLADLFFYYTDKPSVEYPVKIAWLLGFGSSGAPLPNAPVSPHPFGIVLVDNSNNVVFDSTTAQNFNQENFDGRLKIITWRKPKEYVRLVIHTQYPEGFQSPELSPTILANVDISAECIYKEPRKLKTFGVQDSPATATFIEVTEGFNTSLLSERLDIPFSAGESEFFRDPRFRVTITAGEGLGKGRYIKPPTTELAIRTINQISGDVGNFQIKSKGSTHIGRPTNFISNQNVENLNNFQFMYPGLSANSATAAVKITGTGNPCCDCIYFSNTYKALRNQWLLDASLYGQAKIVADGYNSAAREWLTRVQDGEANSLNAQIFKSPGCRARWGVSYCHTIRSCVQQVKIRLSWLVYKNGQHIPPEVGDSSAVGSITISPGNGIIEPAIFAEGRILDFSINKLDPGQLLRLAGTHSFSCSGEEDDDYHISLHVVVWWDQIIINPNIGAGSTPIAGPYPDDVLQLWSYDPVSIPAGNYQFRTPPITL